LAKGSSKRPADGLLDGGILGERCSLLPKAEVWRSFKASEVLESLAALSDGEGDSRPNLEGTEDGHGPAGYRAAFEMPLESNEAGSGASRTERPFAFAGDNARPYRLASSSRGEPYTEPEYPGVSIVGRPFSRLGWRPR